MSVKQSDYNEIRYFKRKALEEESRIRNNGYRDQIRQFGVDCVYYKLDETFVNSFKGIIDKNTILKRAYGYELNPDYSMSAEMITYPEAQQDIFLMNKFGYNPNGEIDFYFHKIDFACALATKCGQLKEYKIDEEPFICEVPALNDEDAFPYQVEVSGVQPQYHCGILSGNFRALIYPYELSNDISSNEYTIVCDPYEHTSFNIQFPVNNDLYRSLKYEIENDDYLETLIYLTYRIHKIKEDQDNYKYVLSGYTHGSVLFYDINKLGKYLDLIRPAVGDIIELDFPDDQNHEKYEITDCYDKELTQDGISPLLHKYVWKCKARRYINSYEDTAPQSEADDRIEEIHKYNQVIDAKVTEEISMYDVISGDIKEDDVYGGMGNVIHEYDSQKPEPGRVAYDFVDDGTAIDLIRFAVGSRLITDGYDLLFMDNSGIFYQVTKSLIPLPEEHSCMFEQNLRWLKASDSQIVFVNVAGESFALVIDQNATQHQLELCLNALYEKSLDVGRPLNENDQNFYKFKGTRTYLWSDGEHLYAKLQSSNGLYKII